VSRDIHKSKYNDRLSAVALKGVQLLSIVRPTTHLLVAEFYLPQCTIIRLDHLSSVFIFFTFFKSETKLEVSVSFHVQMLRYITSYRISTKHFIAVGVIKETASSE